MSSRGQTLAPTALPLASSVGEITVREFGYGLGPPTGVLVVRRASFSRFISSGEMLWIRSGVAAEVRGLRSQTVLRVALRSAPPALTALAAAALTPAEEVGARLLGIARPGVDEPEGLRARVDILDGLAAAPAVPVDFRTAAYLHDRSVTETAHLVGYASASAFVTAFTREYGQTPGEFSGGGGASGARTRDQRIMSPRL